GAAPQVQAALQRADAEDAAGPVGPVVGVEAALERLAHRAAAHEVLHEDGGRYGAGELQRGVERERLVGPDDEEEVAQRVAARALEGRVSSDVIPVDLEVHVAGV